MRAYQIFAEMKPERAVELAAVLSKEAPALWTQALAAASAAMKARPVYLMRQPAEKRAEAVRRALARVRANAVAEEVLASYFLDCRRELLVEWLDAAGVAHEEGVLADEEPASPEPEKLRTAVAGFLEGEGRPDRELLLRAFAAQSAIEWPALEALLEE